MKKFNTNLNLLKGQVLPIVALMMFAIVGMVALVLDGGALMSYRRTAQAAADAGALAGAQHVCWNLSNNTDAAAIARTYAIENGASASPQPVVTIDGKVVTVQTIVQGGSFFANIFGVDMLTTTAEATAGCFGPRGRGAVPITWHCWENNPYDPNAEAFDPELGCQIQILSWDIIGDFIDKKTNSVTIDGKTYQRHTDLTSIVDNSEVPPITPGEIYILYDGNKLCIEQYYDTCQYNTTTDEYCCTVDGVTTCGYDNLDGDIRCDLDDDGKRDIQVSGDRGVVYLTSGTSNINDWITSDTQPDLTKESHIWLTGKDGIGSVVGKMEDYGWAGALVKVPVYNGHCDVYPNTTPYPQCVIDAHTSPWPPFPDGGDVFDLRPGQGGDGFFHIITYQPFYISCVSASGDCPGYRNAQTMNSTLKDNVPIIEGYFISGVPKTAIDPNVTCDIDLGNCHISLMEKPEDN